MNKWRSCTVGDLVKEKIIAPPMDGNHGDIHPKGEDFTLSGIPFVMASDINSSVIDLAGCKFISKEQADKLRKGFSVEGDVLLTHKATIGRTAIVPKINFPYLMLTPQVTYYRVLNKEQLDNRFLKYFFDCKPFQETLGLWAGAGSTRAYLGITGQHNLSLKIPDIKTQKKIADVLKAIDDKIELNNRINAELEAMAKTLYDFWFVQFDFPDENGKPYKTSGGKMVYNPTLKREIPVGWEVKSLNQCVDKILDHRGKTPLKLGGDWANKGEGVIALSAKHIKDGKLIKLDEANIVSFEMYEKWMPEKLKDGDVLMTSEAPAGEFYFIQGKTDYCMSQRVFGIRANPKVLLPSLMYYELSNGHGFSQILSSLSGSTVFGIRQDVLREIKLLVPVLNLQEQFNHIVLPQLAQIKIIDHENDYLTKLRDWLLPMLMSGQVTVQTTNQSSVVI